MRSANVGSCHRAWNSSLGRFGLQWMAPSLRYYTEYILFLLIKESGQIYFKNAITGPVMMSIFSSDMFVVFFLFVCCPTTSEEGWIYGRNVSWSPKSLAWLYMCFVWSEHVFKMDLEAKHIFSKYQVQ